MPVRHIKILLKEHKTLYKAFEVLNEQVRNYGRVAGTYSRIGNSRNKRGIELQLIEQGSQIPKELHAAKKKVEKEASKSLFLPHTSTASTLYLNMDLQHVKFNKKANYHQSNAVKNKKRSRPKKQTYSRRK